MKTAVIFLADGFEEVEACTPIDYLRRAGVSVSTCALGSERTVKGSHGIAIVADTTVDLLAPAAQWDAVLLPGGMPGTAHLADSPSVGTFVQAMQSYGKIVAAICAAPALVLAPLNMLKGKKYTCFPGLEDKVTEAFWSADRVVVDGNLITSRAAGTAGEWAAAIIHALCGAEAAQRISANVLLGRAI
ncbi:MAG: DJ-1/PfpI family protein [Treponema sp.]|jgi:4-methyl-5(b-hydroxyethyl)-thiazole monophosphate biosynthesis|nr:DJ-1/PfpI family protein [Treponema sp.]